MIGLLNKHLSTLMRRLCRDSRTFRLLEPLTRRLREQFLLSVYWKSFQLLISTFDHTSWRQRTGWLVKVKAFLRKRSCAYRTIILPVVLYGCETWSLTLREERRLSVFENRVLRRIFGPRRDEVTGEWRKLHNEQLNDLYSTTNIIQMIKSRRMSWVVHVALMGGEERRIQGFGGETWRKETTWETQT